MKCKYCDYENPKDAIVCECCGATLATQKPLSYYKKQARKKIKNKNEKVKRRTSTRARKAEWVKEPKVHASVNAFSIVFPIAVFLIFSIIFSGVFVFMIKFNYSFPEYEQEDTLMVVFNPETGKNYFLLGGRLISGTVVADGEFRHVMSSPSGNAVLCENALKDEGGETYYSYLLISDGEIRELSIPTEVYEKEHRLVGYMTVGEDYFLCIAYDPQAYVESCRLYCIPINGDEDEAFLITEALPLTHGVIVVGTQLICARENGVGFRVMQADLTTGEYEYITDTVRNVTLKQAKDFIIIKADNTLSCYYSDTKEKLDISFENHSFLLSPDEKTVAFTNTENGNYVSYVRSDGVIHNVGSGFVIRSLSNDAKTIYGEESDFSVVYSTDIDGNVKKLAEGAYLGAADGSGTQTFMFVDDDLYFSVKGAYPVKVRSGIESITRISGCENGFAGGLFNVVIDKTDYICCMNKSYELEVLLSGDLSFLLLDDNKTVLLEKGGMLYQYTEGSSKLKTIGAGKIGSIICKGGLGYYFYNGRSVVYRTGSGEMISQRSDSDACYFDGCVIFAERDTPHHLPENPEETDAEEDLPSADGQSESFDLYSSFRGGKKKLIMENVYRYKCTGTAIYIFKESEKTYEGETLYDVYGGSSLDNIELLISGVLPTR